MGHTDRGLLISNKTDACVFLAFLFFFFLYAITNALSEESIEHIGKPQGFGLMQNQKDTQICHLRKYIYCVVDICLVITIQYKVIGSINVSTCLFSFSG